MHVVSRGSRAELGYSCPHLALRPVCAELRPSWALSGSGRPYVSVTPDELLFPWPCPVQENGSADLRTV